jgi:hypothetical protein
MDASDPFDSTDVDAVGSAPGDAEAARAAAASMHKRTYQACVSFQSSLKLCDLRVSLFRSAIEVLTRFV